MRLLTGMDWVYILEQTPDLSTWSGLRIFNGTGAGIQLTNALTGQARFFRARLIPRTIPSKPGSAINFKVADSAQAEGELPAGIAFNNGTFAGTPSAAAAEKYTSGNYTNVVRLSADGIDSSAEIIHHVKMSFAQNIYAQRPSGPSLGSVCLACHGSGFPPNFTPNATTIINVDAGSGGDCPSTWDYIVPGSTAQSLIYQKVTSPP